MLEAPNTIKNGRRDDLTHPQRRNANAPKAYKNVQHHQLSGKCELKQQ